MVVDLADREKELIKRVSEGDEQAFGVMFYQYLPVLHPFVFKFTKSEYATEEVIQNTFIRVWLNREKLECVLNLRSWLYKYASNECLNYLRSQKQKDKVENDISETSFLGHNSHDTSDAIKINEINRLIGEAVDKLPSQRKRIYLLSRQTGKTIPEIAEELQLSPNTVKNALVISLKSLREYLLSHGYKFSLLYFLFSQK